ncbi:MAG TPA: hypothetical protein VFZ09_29335, partial [Archangium sp.]|nr:hypothetical protein [Archangium sp.]
MSTPPMGMPPASARRRPGLSAWALIVLLLHAACVTSVPRGGRRVESPSGPPPVVAVGEAGDERVHLSVPTRFGAVRVSDSELDDALATLVLNVPLRLADCPVPLYLHRKLALASVPLTGEAWRTPLARSYGGFCERQGTPGDCLGLFKDGPGLDGEDKRDLALALSVNAALEARD